MNVENILLIIHNLVFPYQCIRNPGAEGGLGRPGSVSADPGSAPCPGPVSLPVVPAGAVTAPQL